MSADATGAIPKCHIPARFTVLIPQEFPASNVGTKKLSNEAKRSSKKVAPRVDETDSTLNKMISEMAYGVEGEDFDPLVDFSAGGSG